MMCNSCQSNCCCGCALMENVASALNNLFSTRPYCNRSCCGCSRSREYLNGFVSGVNASNASYCGHGCHRECGYTGCGCNRETRSTGCYCDRRERCGSDCSYGGTGTYTGGGSCGSQNLSSYTNCGGAANDEYYARQYGLNTCPVRICSCN